MQDFRTKANQIAFTNTETLEAGNVQKAIETVESKIPFDEFGGNKLFLNPSMSASEINLKIENMENKGIVIFEEGTYNLEETLSISNKKDLTFVGDGEVLLEGFGGNLLLFEACENIKISKVDMSESERVIHFQSHYVQPVRCLNIRFTDCKIKGEIITNNMDGFLLEGCFIDGILRNQSKNTKIVDCVFTEGIAGYSGTDSLKIENTEILDGGLNVYMLDTDGKKADILNTKVQGESYFSGENVRFENVIFQDRVQIYGTDIQVTSCDFLYDGEAHENKFSAYVSKLKMEKCFINGRRSFIDKNSGTVGGATINNCVFMGEVVTYSEGFNISNSEILGGLIHGGKNSIISNNNISSDNIGLHADKATKCSITNNIVNSIVDDSGSETDPKEGNYYLGNRTESMELLADEGYTNIAIVEDSLQSFADSLDYLQNKFN